MKKLVLFGFLVLFFVSGVVAYAEPIRIINSGRDVVGHSMSMSSDEGCANPVMVKGDGVEIADVLALLFNLSDEKREEIIIELEEFDGELNREVCDVEEFFEMLINELEIDVGESEVEEVSDYIEEEIEEIRERIEIYDDNIELPKSDLAAKSLSGLAPASYAPFSDTLLEDTFVIAIYSDWEDDTWPDSKIDDSVDEIVEMINWMDGVAPEVAGFEMWGVAYNSSSTTEPKSSPDYNLYVWGDEAVRNLGFWDVNGDGSAIDDMMEYHRVEYGTRNVIVLFMSYMEKRSYAYGDITSIYAIDDCVLFFCSLENFPLYAHETLHLFGAHDEYYQPSDGTGCLPWSCTSENRWGYVNGNCANPACGLDSVPCIMKSHRVFEPDPPEIEYYSRGQIGWGDHDGDLNLDPVDNCMWDYNYLQENNDGDSMGDVCDLNDDNDFVLDIVDACPLVFGDFCNGCPEIPCDEGKVVFCEGIDEPYCDVSPLEIISVSPLGDVNYSERRVLFDLRANKICNEIFYVDNLESRPRERRLCRDCDSYNKIKSLRDGEHTLDFICEVGDEIARTSDIFLTIDSKDPRISRTYPWLNKFTNGSGFYVKYSEDNCASLGVSVFGGGGEIGVGGKCESGRGVEVFRDLDLSSFEGEEVVYRFRVEDIAGNFDESRLTSVVVDTTYPLLNNPDDFWWQDGRYIYFNLNISELNFEEVVYSYVDSRGRLKEKRLCSRLRGGICEKRKSFSSGAHDLTVRILDEAGNFIEKDVGFFV